MTLHEQAQAEAKEMIQSYTSNGRDCALISINKVIGLRVPPMEYYEAVKQAIINHQ